MSPVRVRLRIFSLLTGLVPKLFTLERGFAATKNRGTNSSYRDVLLGVTAKYGECRRRENQEKSR